MPDFADRFWTSRDGLKLHYRDYAARSGGAAGRPPLLCLPGLTRNARDFEELAARLSGDWRVLCPDMRGRGDSAYAKDSATYNPMQYVDDVALLLEQAGIARIVAIGTSLGGLMTMAMAMIMPDRIAGAVINDVGPVIEAAGLERIKGYVGQGRSFPTWMHAARAVEETQGAAYPDYEIADDRQGFECRRGAAQRCHHVRFKVDLEHCGRAVRHDGNFAELHESPPRARDQRITGADGCPSRAHLPVERRRGPGDEHHPARWRDERAGTPARRRQGAGMRHELPYGTKPRRAGIDVGCLGNPG